MKKIMMITVVILAIATQAQALSKREVYGEDPSGDNQQLQVDNSGRLLTAIDSGISASFDTVTVTIGNLETINSDMRDNLDTQIIILSSLSDSGAIDIFDSGYFVYATVAGDSKQVEYVVTDRVPIGKTLGYSLDISWYDNTGDDRDGKPKAIGYKP